MSQPAIPSTVTALSDSSDEDLIRQCLEGRDEAWGLLIDKYTNLIYSIPIRHGLSRDDANDIFQSVCVTLMSRLADLRNPRALPAWLIQTCWHKCIQWKRQQERLVPVSDDEAPEMAAAETAVPDHLVRELEREQILRNAVVELPPRCRKLIEMLFFESPSRPYQAVAESLGIATGSIGFIRMRCLEKLRRSLERKGF